MRLLLLILLTLSAPYWLAFRQGFGRSFYVVIIIASLAGIGLAGALDFFLAPDVAQARAGNHAPQYASLYWTVLGFTWCWHVLAAATGAKYWRKDHRPASWSVGHFHFWRGAPLFTDTILFMALSPNLYYVYEKDPQTLTLVVIISSVISYYFIEVLAHFNGGALPFKGRPTRIREARAKPEKPYQTALKSMPKAERDGLSEIFSRRPGGLRRLASEQS